MNILRRITGDTLRNRIVKVAFATSLKMSYNGPESEEIVNRTITGLQMAKMEDQISSGHSDDLRNVGAKVEPMSQGERGHTG